MSAHQVDALVIFGATGDLAKLETFPAPVGLVERGVEAAWRVVQPVLGDVVPVQSYARGSWGPPQADALVPGGEAWRNPGA